MCILISWENVDSILLFLSPNNYIDGFKNWWLMLISVLYQTLFVCFLSGPDFLKYWTSMYSIDSKSKCYVEGITAITYM